MRVFFRYLVSILFVGLVLVFFLILFGGYKLGWEWAGYGAFGDASKGIPYERAKTLWDWLGLLIIPVTILDF